MSRANIIIVLLIATVVAETAYILFINRRLGEVVPNQRVETQKNASGSVDLWKPWLGLVGTDKKAGECSLGEESRVNNDNLKNNKSLLKLLRDNCFIALRSVSLDMTGDSVDELAVVVANESCASCHSNIVYIFSGERIIFQKRGADIAVNKPTLPVTGFSLMEPLRHYDEAMCCASEELIYTYKYSPNEKQSNEDKVAAAYSRMYSFGNVEPSDSPFFLYDVRSNKIVGAE